VKAASGWPAALSLAAAIALLLLALTPLTTLWDRDEPRFAQAAVEMRASGDYLVPTFSGEVRPQKPPLIYWLMTLSLSLFGQREFAVRFWSPVGIAVSAIATFVVARRLASPRAALLAMIVLAATPLTLVEGVAATTDAVLLALITSSVAIGVEWFFRPPTWRHTVALGALLGLGALTKGPVAVALPLAVLAAALALTRDAIPWRGRMVAALGCSAIVGVVVFAAWYVPAASRTATIGARGPLYETLARVIEIQEGHGTSIWVAPFYYAVVIAIGFAPWTARLFAAIHASVRTRARSTADVLLAVWILVPFVAFTLAATKLPHYILPVWPALAIAVARTFDAGGSIDDGQIRRVGRWAGLAAGVVLVAGLVASPSIERAKPVAEVAQAVRAANVDGPLFAYDFAEPSLVFYSGRPLIEIPNEAVLVEWARAPGPALLATTRAAMTRIEHFYGPLGLREIAAKRGWNYVKGTRVELVAFIRGSDR